MTSYLPIFAGFKATRESYHATAPRPAEGAGLPRAVRLDYDRDVGAPATDVFLGSLKRCLRRPDFLTEFYRRFVMSSDEVRAKFQGVDLKRQARVLEDSLYVVAVAVQGEEGSLARGDLPRIAERHSRRDLDVRPELYDAWSDCLVDTAREHDPEWTDAIAAAWRETLAFGVEYMRRRY